MHLTERRVSYRKVAKTWFSSQCDSASLCDETHANRTASMIEWYDRNRAYNISFKRRRRRNSVEKNSESSLVVSLGQALVLPHLSDSMVVTGGSQ